MKSRGFFFSFPSPSAPPIEETASKSHEITTNQMKCWFSPVVLGALGRTASTTARTSSENVTSCFSHHLSIIPSSLACKMC